MVKAQLLCCAPLYSCSVRQRKWMGRIGENGEESSSPLESPYRLMAIAVLMAALGVYISAPNAPQPAKRMTWIDNKTDPKYMTRWLLNYSAPVVLLNSPFDEWVSVDWTFEYLADLVPTVKSKISKNNVFKYHAEGKPLSQKPRFKVKKLFKEKTYTGKNFFRLLQKESSKKIYYYATEDVEQLKMGEIYRMDSLSKISFRSYEQGQVNFWFGGANVTAYTHYDTSHNLHTIIRGRKRFLLFPPSAYSYLRLYPSLHTYYRQVQLNVLNLTDNQFRELLYETSSIEVVLTRGETLYIPPYWFHTVVTLEPTISLNVWSHSDSFLNLEEIYTLPIPFEEVWGSVKLMRVLNHFLTVIINGTLPHYKNNLTEFLNYGLMSRYGVVFDKLTDKNEEELLSSVEVFCLKSEVTKILDSPSLRKVNKGTKKIIEVFNEMHPLSVREINMVNYLEHVAWRILGNKNVLLVPFYYKKCFLF